MAAPKPISYVETDLAALLQMLGDSVHDQPAMSADERVNARALCRQAADYIRVLQPIERDIRNRMAKS
jgi:hypothetical protein